MKKSVTASLFTATLVLSLLFTACNNSQNKDSHHEHSDHEEAYACPMHPEVTGKKGDKCPECGMDLVAVSHENASKVEVKLATEPQTPEAGIPVKLTLAFQENNQNVPLEISHDKKVHLMMADESLSWFQHIHPKEQADGSYTVEASFPRGGKYFLFTDFKAQGTASAVDKKELIVNGSSGNAQAGSTTKLVSVTDGYTLTLKNGNDLKTNRSQSLEISVEKDGRKLVESDIEPYLGATAHIAMIGKEDKDFLHIHPVSGKLVPIYAEAHIEKPGIYRIWVEFQTNGKVHTADFTVNVTEGEKGADGGHKHLD